MDRGLAAGPCLGATTARAMAATAGAAATVPAGWVLPENLVIAEIRTCRDGHHLLCDSLLCDLGTAIVMGRGATVGEFETPCLSFPSAFASGPAGVEDPVNDVDVATWWLAGP